MVTFIIIVCVIIIIWAYKAQAKAEKKVDVVDGNKRTAAINRLQQVKYNFRDKSKLEKIFGVWDDPLAIFSYSDRFLFVKYKDGKNFTVHLDQMEVLFRFEPSIDSRIAIITLGSSAKITHQREILTKESREKAIHDYQLAKAISRTNRNIQRMNRF